MADALARMRARRAERRLAEVTDTRSCAGCDLCCTAPGIAQLRKPPGEPCVHLSGEPGRSCSIYASRPKICIDFHCLWRVTETVLPDWLRPADCGFMIAFNRLDEFPGVVTVHPDPARPLAWKTLWAQTVFSILAERWNCLVAIGQAPGTSHIFCPDGTRLTLADYSPADRAKLVRDDGTIGAPRNVFGPDRRPLAEQIRETLFDWSALPPPTYGTCEG
jgi:hypothetical protein